jgi:hypothetical protein
MIFQVNRIQMQVGVAILISGKTDCKSKTRQKRQRMPLHIGKRNNPLRSCNREAEMGELQFKASQGLKKLTRSYLKT